MVHDNCFKGRIEHNIRRGKMKYRAVNDIDGRIYDYTEVFRKLEDNKLYVLKRMDCECHMVIEVEPI